MCGLGPGVSAMALSALRDSSPPRGSLPLWIRLPEWRKTLVVLVTANDTVLDVKNKINEAEWIVPEQQHLVCGPISGSGCQFWTMPAQLGATCHCWSRVTPVTIRST